MGRNAVIGASGCLANGAAARKTTTDSSTTVRASRRSALPAGRVDRNTPRSFLDRDCRCWPGVMTSEGAERRESSDLSRASAVPDPLGAVTAYLWEGKIICSNAWGRWDAVEASGLPKIAEGRAKFPMAQLVAGSVSLL